jgi:hypothetical protein
MVGGGYRYRVSGLGVTIVVSFLKYIASILRRFSGEDEFLSTTY